MAAAADVLHLASLIGRTVTVTRYATDEIGNSIYPWQPVEVGSGVLASVAGTRNAEGAETVTLTWADGGVYEMTDNIGALSFRVE